MFVSVVVHFHVTSMLNANANANNLDNSLAHLFLFSIVPATKFLRAHKKKQPNSSDHCSLEFISQNQPTWNNIIFTQQISISINQNTASRIDDRLQQLGKNLSTIFSTIQLSFLGKKNRIHLQSPNINWSQNRETPAQAQQLDCSCMAWISDPQVS